MLRNFCSRLFPTPKVGFLEAFLARALLAFIVFSSLQGGVDFDAQPHPAGLAHLFDLTWLADSQIQRWWQLVAGILLGTYVLGVCLPLVLPLIALAHILPFTLFNSQGYTHHGHQIVSLVLVAQSVTVWWHSIRHRHWFGFPDAVLRAWTLVQTQVVVTGVYLVSVLSKLDATNWKWIWKSAYIPMDMVKTRRQNYLNRLDPQYATDPPLAAWLLENPWISRAMFGSGFLIEAFAWLAIGTRWPALLVGLAIIGMHRSIHNLMGLSFDQNEMLCWVYLVNLPFLAACLLTAIWRKLAPSHPLNGGTSRTG